MKKLFATIALVITLFPVGIVEATGVKDAVPVPDEPYFTVTRFWSQAYKGHFYTADSNEAAAVTANNPTNVWQNEGSVYKVFNPQLCQAVPPPPGYCLPVYRFWSNAYKHHFYTISEGEKANIINTMPEWQYEGVAYAANTVTAPFMYKPLYRFWSDQYKGHFYTTDEAEKANIISNMSEWNYEGIAYYVIDLNWVFLDVSII
jgi:hypothetical protein